MSKTPQDQVRISASQYQPFRNHTSSPFEIFILLFSILPFFVLAYFYPVLPERAPLLVNLNGEVATWAEKSVLSVFRVPLMAAVTQIVLILMKYGTLHSAAIAPLEPSILQTKLEQQYFRLNARLWDWFRAAVAIKMCAESLDTVFLSLDRFKFLARPAFIISAVAAMVGVAGALFYGYRLLVVRREMKEKFVDAYVETPIEVERVYGRVLYFNPSDSALFVRKYIVNFGNKWAWVFIACLIAYPLLVFLPTSGEAYEQNKILINSPLN